MSTRAEGTEERRHGDRLWRAALFCGALVAAFQPACSKQVTLGGGPQDPSDGPVKKDTTIVHEDCDITDKTAERIDVNADGKSDITIVKAGGKEKCRAVDLNFDGAVDAWVYTDAGGQIRRRESDYDRDGRVDEISIFKGGALAEQQRATTLGGKLDTWHYFERGKISRTERDSDGDTVIDQWWEYPANPECPLIHSDLDGDGKPDKDATIDVCKDTGYVPSERPGSEAPKSKTFERLKPEDIPEKKPEGGEQ